MLLVKVQLKRAGGGGDNFKKMFAYQVSLDL